MLTKENKIFSTTSLTISNKGQDDPTWIKAHYVIHNLSIFMNNASRHDKQSVENDERKFSSGGGMAPLDLGTNGIRDDLHDYTVVRREPVKVMRWTDNLIEVASFQGSKKRPLMKPPSDPGEKTPPIRPPKRDPQPEPINDPPVPPSPGTDPNDEPLPIGDPPDKSDQPIRMGLMTVGTHIEGSADYSLRSVRVSSIKRNCHKVCVHSESRERSVLCLY